MITVTEILKGAAGPTYAVKESVQKAKSAIRNVGSLASKAVIAPFYLMDAADIGNKMKNVARGNFSALASFK